jgi:hypothetical protein
MDDWEKEIEGLLRGEQQQREERTKKTEDERKAREENRKKAIAFVGGVPLRALKTLEKGLQEQRQYAIAGMDEAGISASIEVERKVDETTGPKRFVYAIEAIYTASGVTAQAKWKYETRPVDAHPIQRDGQILSADKIIEKDIIADFMQAYRSTFGG